MQRPIQPEHLKRVQTEKILVMKRLIATVMTVLALSLSLAAQPAKGYEYPLNEFSISYGRVSYPHAIMTFGGVLGSAFTGGLSSMDKCVSTGAFGFEYMRYVHPHVAVGANVSYEAILLQFKNKDGELQDAHWSHFASVMPAVKFPWFSRYHFRMYTKLAVGLMIEGTAAYETENSDGTKTTTPASCNPNVAFQVSPVCFDFGGYRARGFVETGFGVNGLISAGFRYGF